MNLVTLIPNKYKDPRMQCFAGVFKLLSDEGVRVRVPQKYSGEVAGFDVETDDGLSGVGMVIVIGGDGSILRASKLAASAGIPLIGINLGKVGYMAAIEPEDISALRSIIQGNYQIEERMMLKIKANDRVLYALNDAVISNGRGAKMVDIELECNSLPVSSYRADGIVIATPTGSKK